MSKYVVNALNYAYNPHSNTDTIITMNNHNGLSSSTSSSSSSSSSDNPLHYRNESSSDGSSDEEEYVNNSRIIPRKRKSYSLSSSYSNDGYYDENSDDDDEDSDIYEQKKKLSVINEVKRDNRLIVAIASHFDVDKEGLYKIYSRFKNLPYDSHSEKLNELFWGLRILSFGECTLHDIILNEDTSQAVQFLNIHQNQHKGLVVTNLSHKGDTYMVDQKIHDTLYYTITRALVERIIQVLKTSKKPQPKLIAVLKKEMPHVYSKHSMSHVHCKNKVHLEKANGGENTQCLNNHVIYTKTTSKLYTFIRNVATTKFSIDQQDGDVAFVCCDFALPIPFYLVLFLCGLSTDFKSEYNMKLNGGESPMTTTTNNTSIVQSVDSYIDYEKWVCLPLWCLIMYQNVK